MANSSTNPKIIEELTSSPKTRLDTFRKMETLEQGYILYKLPSRVQKDLLNKLDEGEILNLLNPLDPNKATDLLRVLDKSLSKSITEKLNDSVKEKVEFLLKFNPNAAAALMSLDYIIFEKNAKMEEVIGEIEKYENKIDKFPAIFVIDNGKFTGEVPATSLIFHKGKILSEKYIKKIPTVKYDVDSRVVINSFVKNPHNKIVVLDEDESILGVIHSDDILKLIDKHATRDLYGFAGVEKEEDVLDSALTKVKYRYKWLILNLGTAFLAASVVGLFETTISKFTLLAVYMPIVAGMGGNAGTQALAVAVRGLVLKEVQLKTSAKLILNEMEAGAINGVINGIIVAAIAIAFNHSPALGFVIGIAMVVNLIVAGFFGALVPMIMKTLGKDPASSATIFITTATDVIGFFVFLGLASIVL
ncbi:MAG: magnesium transporter [Candidatus Curtissbacteria bacterium]